MIHPAPGRTAFRLPRLVAILALLTVSFAALGAAGCNRTKAPYEPKADPYSGQQQIYPTSPKLRNILRYGQISTARDESDLLYVTVPVRSTDSRRQIVEYRVTFFDRTNTPLPGGAWKTMTLEPNAQEIMSFNSTTSRAEDFQLVIREAEAG